MAMADRPHLFFPPAEINPRERVRPKGGGKSVGTPEKERQEERLEPKFEALQQSTLALHQTAEGAIPEEMLVFEVAGEVRDFAIAARHAGLDLVMSVDGEFQADDDFFDVIQSGDREGERREGPVSERVYLTSTSQEALHNVSSLYERWKRGDEFERGYTRWRDVFDQLVDVRFWDARDRFLDTGLEEDWALRLESGASEVPVEVELFFADSPELRGSRETYVRQAIVEGGGEVTARCELPAIRYHALLAQLPAARAEAILFEVDRLREEGVVSDALVQEVGVQFFRPAGQAATPLVMVEEELQEDEGAVDERLPEGDPIVALLDGLPLQNHNRLSGRLIVDAEPEVEEGYLAHLRQHGTAMASLIIWGDLNAGEPPLRRPLYVRPIMRPHIDRGWSEEQVPGLVVDMVHQAVRRMFVGDGDGPVASTIQVINVSIGEEYRPFLKSVSPFARLLDWLSYEYRVLFVVSAGNYSEHPEIEGVRTDLNIFDEFQDGDALERALLADSHREQRHRRLFAPAESFNSLTVGASNEDHSGETLPRRVVAAYRTAKMPAFYSRRGPGPKRSIKPDILNSGGKMALRLPYGDARWRRVGVKRQPPGHLVASPGFEATGGLNSLWYESGTSNAAALTSRLADRLYDVLWSLRRSKGGESIDAAPVALWLKAMLVHSASWPADAAEVVRDVLRSEGVSGRKLKEVMARAFGFGVVDPDAVMACADHRVTLLGAGVTRHDDDQTWSLPLPPSLSGKAGPRRLVVTLASFIPPPLRVQSARSVKLFFEAPNHKWIARDRQANHNAVRRGTVHHEVFEGDQVELFVPEAALTVHVKCDDREKDSRGGPIQIPYALIATLDVAPEMGVPVYEEVKAGIEARAKIGTRARG